MESRSKNGAVSPGIKKFHVHCKTLKKNDYQIRTDSAFTESCKPVPRRVRPGRYMDTRGNDRGLHAYIQMGIAHSVETWREGELAGGLYGVAVAGAFLGNQCFPERPIHPKLHWFIWPDNWKVGAMA
ncbi:MAG: hypothetical protein P0107_01865 [Nitrosomonas sp.]|nr:hypothetical protein [Nitrosomonas sp.]